MLHDYAQQCEILVHSFISLQHAAQAATAGPSLRDLPGTMLGVKPRPCFHFSLSLWHASRRRAARAGSWACALRSHWHRCNLGGHDPARQVSLLLRAHQMLLDEYRELVSFCQQRNASSGRVDPPTYKTHCSLFRIDGVLNVRKEAVTAGHVCCFPHFY